MRHVLECTGYEVLTRQIVRGEGSYIYDINGKCYVDFEAGVWCTSLGHNQYDVNQAIITQLGKISHVGYRYPNNIVEETAQKVLETLDMLDGKCVFLNSGSEAVELGVQMARELSPKPLLLTFSDTYLSAYGSSGKKLSEEWYLFDWSPCKTCTKVNKCDINCELIKNIPFEILGGFVFEPGNSSGLIKLPPKQLVKTLEKLIKQNNGIIVVDEVTTGVGRTGKWYGYMHYNITPDIIAIGKGIGNGYPVSIVAIKQNIDEALGKTDFHYAQSHQNDALGCAVVKEVIKVIGQENLVIRSKELGKWFLKELEKLVSKYGIIKEVRGRGLMLGIEFKESIDQDWLKELNQKLFIRGYMIGYKKAANLFRFYPALNIKKKDIEMMLENLDEAILKML
ncbi:class-III pyridoxal-phosphate-dependent aminotransferase [Paramaledivibacter caminithermalis]|uniref:Acetylornithine aminotransferase n=1 Tax=Paramaledivibacter caminithermalis (strain DSM 15212 / CIP 107654 / DViRD3) TaxID=1121301 RepID=A0A1M6QS12_PARC5|nr:aspartate aminotransferase family protein [Paramaledivibacter caminithermalis]SHK23004.1 acetylornithine aminotransferase [Paramaledivibacter caminithermalis DSM 15212]